MSILRSAALMALTAVLLQYLPAVYRSKPPVVTDGYTAPGFEEVAAVFRENFETGRDSRYAGSAFAVYYRGQKVVDLWGGYADVESERRWAEDTLTIAFSSTKGVAAVCLAMLVDRGLLDYDKPVAHYWHEFAQKGKEKITVRQLLGHKAGLVVSAPPGFSLDILRDIPRAGEMMAAAEPQWEVDGQRQGYHMFTYGPLTNELLRRVDPQGRTMGQFFREELAEPFGIDFHIGLPLEESHRVARLRASDTSPLVQLIMGVKNYRTRQLLWSYFRSDLLSRAMANAGDAVKPKFFNNPENRLLEIPSASGYGQADALAKFYSILSQGGTDPVTNQTIVSRDRIDEFMAPNPPTFDQMLGVPLVFNVGMMRMKYLDCCPIFGHPGAGGQQGFADPKHQLGVSFLSSYMAPTMASEDQRSVTLVQALYECIEKLEHR